MAEELTTRDVFQQVDARLTRVEDDLRALREEMNGRFDRLGSDTSDRFDQLERETHATFRWLVGVVLLSWLSLMVSIWLK